MARQSKFIAALNRFLARVFQFDTRFLLVLTAVAAVGVLWWQDRKRLETRIEKLEAYFTPRTLNGPVWGLVQATGAPNTTTAGDQPTAWASATPDGGPEWLELNYAQAVKPYEIDVYETYNPGAITKITAFDQFGNEEAVWEGTDPTAPTARMGVSKFEIKSGFSTNRIRVYLASDKVPGWNEIDAVGLKYGWMGSTIWADQATASSTFGSAVFYR